MSWVAAGTGAVADRVSNLPEPGPFGDAPQAVLTVDPTERRLPDAALQAGLQFFLDRGLQLPAVELLLVFAPSFATAYTRRLVSRVEDPTLRVRPRDSTDMETSESIRYTLDLLGQGTPHSVLILASAYDPALVESLTQTGTALVLRYETWGVEDPRKTDVWLAWTETESAIREPSSPAVISGAGLVSAYGVGTKPYAEGLAAGVDPLPDAGLSGDVTRRIGGVVGSRSADWLTEAIEEALDEARWTPPSGKPLLILAAQATSPDGVASGNPIYAPRTVTAGGHTWTDYLVVSHACASVLFGLDLARRILLSGAHPAVLVASVSECTACMVDSLGVVRAIGSSPSRPFDLARDGITIGEGAGALLVELGPSATGRGVADPTELAATAATVRGRSAAASDRDAVLGCLLQAVEEAGATRIDYVHAHATGTPQGDAAEAEAVSDLAAKLGVDTLPVSSHKGALGHLLHASALPGIVAGRQALRGGVLPGSVNLHQPLEQPGVTLLRSGEIHQPPGGVQTVLVNAFGFGGNNATALLRRSTSIEGV